MDGLVVAPGVDNIMAPTIAPAPLATATVDLTIAPKPLAAAAVDLNIAPAGAAAVVPPAAPNPNGVPRDFDLNVEIPWE